MIFTWINLILPIEVFDVKFTNMHSVRTRKNVELKEDSIITIFKLIWCYKANSFVYKVNRSGHKVNSLVYKKIALFTKWKGLFTK